MTSVFPELDPSHPAKCDPARIVAAIRETEATTTSWAFEFVPLYLQHESSFGYRKATGFPVPSLRPPVTRTTAWATIRTLPGEVPTAAPIHDARQVIETYGPEF